MNCSIRARYNTRTSKTIWKIETTACAACVCAMESYIHETITHLICAMHVCAGIYYHLG